MSLVVKLEDDLGERSDWIMLYGVIPSRDERDFPCLSRIDPYGKTVFNHLQMETFLAEWEQVRKRAHDESQPEGSLGEDQTNGSDLPDRPGSVFKVCGKLSRRVISRAAQELRETCRRTLHLCRSSKQPLPLSPRLLSDSRDFVMRITHPLPPR